MIELKQICFSYMDETDGGLKDLTLTIRSGECVLLCGRSGCGKTTITRLINGLIPGFFSGELKGTVAIDHKSILGVPMYQLSSHVGSVFQNPRTQFFKGTCFYGTHFGIERCGPVLQETADSKTDQLESGTGRDYRRCRP